jgi:serine protease Do
MMRSAILITVLALPWWAVGQQPPAAPQPPSPPAVPSRFMITPPGSYLGVGIQEITGDRAKALKLPSDTGVEITRVAPDSPAEKAGLKSGDVILQINGIKVESLEQSSKLVRETPVGREVKLEVFRGGASQTIVAKVGEHPQIPGIPDGIGFRMPDVPRVIMGLRSPMLGVEAESIDGQLAQFFGLSDGVLVRTVMKGSAAEKAGVKAGDVIFKVDDVKVATPAEISARLRAAHGKPIPVVLMRERKEMSLTVEASETPRLGRAEPSHLDQQ